MRVLSEVELEQIITRKQEEFQNYAKDNGSEPIKGQTINDLADWGCAVLEEIRHEARKRVFYR